MKNTNKLLVTLLALAVVVSSFAVTTLTTSAADEGMNATIYRMPSYVGIIGEDSYGASVSFENNQKFADTIDVLLASSKLDTEADLTAFPVVTDNGDSYIKKWTGTMTAKETATYTVVGRKIDNGFAMKVDGVLVYEYWGASHWFDGAEDRLPSDKGTISVEAGQSYTVEMYYLELGGGDALDVKVATDADDVATEKAMDDAFTFELKEELYRVLGGNLSEIIGIGNGENGEGAGGNGAQCEEANAKYEASIEAVKALTTVKGETVIVDSFAAAIVDEENYLIEYEGTLVPSVSGEYTFGTAKVDNCFYLEIDGKVAYEFWAGATWNDNTGNTYTETVTLEAGKEYAFKAAFLEIDGGQALELNASVDGGDAQDVAELFTYKPVDTSAPVVDNNNDNTNNDNNDGNNAGDSSSDNTKTGDVASVAAILVAGVAAMGGLKLRKKSK